MIILPTATIIPILALSPSFLSSTSWQGFGGVKPFMLSYGLPAVQQGSRSNTLKNETNRFENCWCEVPLLATLRSGCDGCCSVATVKSNFGCAAPKSCSTKSEQHQVLQLGFHPSSPSFILCSLPSSEAGVYPDSSAAELLVVSAMDSLHAWCHKPSQCLVKHGI